MKEEDNWSATPPPPPPPQKKRTEFLRKKKATLAKDSLDRLRVEIVVLVGPRTAIVIGPIEFCLSDLHQADGDCREEPTDDVIMSLASRQFTTRTSACISPFRSSSSSS